MVEPCGAPQVGIICQTFLELALIGPLIGALTQAFNKKKYLLHIGVSFNIDSWDILSKHFLIPTFQIKIYLLNL